MRTTRKGSENPRCWLMAFGLALMILLAACGSQEESGDGFGDAGAASGFTFLGIGRDSRLSDSLRARLSQQLGAEALEPKAIVDLAVIDPAFLSQHVPALDALHQALNFPPRARVEHNVTRLTYRYARRREMPFTFVELLFDNASAAPLLVRVKASAEGAYLLDTLKKRHGEPQQLAATEARDAASLWQREGETLLFVPAQDRQGRSEYHILIYFTAHLEALVASEAQARHLREQSLQRHGGSAF